MTCKAYQGIGNPSNETITLAEYRPDIGAPFEVVLINAVRQTLSPTGEVLDTCIPNMRGLLKEAALARSLCARKFSAAEIKFVRKAVGLKASDLADLLGISAEHLSRCENGDRALSVAAEKLFRVIILKKRFDYSSIRAKLAASLKNNSLGVAQLDRLRAILDEYSECFADLEKAVFDFKIESVFDPENKLAFGFNLRTHEGGLANANHSQEEERWKRQAA